jgi:hypothetical protein
MEQPKEETPKPVIIVRPEFMEPPPKSPTPKSPQSKTPVQKIKTE